VTNHITHAVSCRALSVDLPLTIYRVRSSWFRGRGFCWYRRHIFLGPLLVVIGSIGVSLHEDRRSSDIKESVARFSAASSVAAVFFHGELAT
jgi:hypothetical protein